MVRIVVIDEHPALREGVRAVIDREPGLVCAGGGSEAEVWPLLARERPDLVLLDYHLPATDGLQLCHRIKRRPSPPRVLVHSAYASPPLALPALLAGADGLIDKGLEAEDLFAAIRRVCHGDRLIPEVSAYLLAEALGQVAEADRPIVTLLADGTPHAEVARVLERPPSDVEEAAGRILTRLSATVRAG